MSIEDHLFLDVVEKEMFVCIILYHFAYHAIDCQTTGSKHRRDSLLYSAPLQENNFVNFIQKIFDHDQAEPAPQLKPGEES